MTNKPNVAEPAEQRCSGGCLAGQEITPLVKTGSRPLAEIITFAPPAKSADAFNQRG